MKPLNFANLQELDNGVLSVLLSEHLQRVARDCLDRPRDAKPRRVTVEFQFVPVCLGKDKEFSHVAMQAKARTKIPDFTSDIYQLKTNPQGFGFNADDPMSIDQQGLFGADDEDTEDA